MVEPDNEKVGGFHKRKLRRPDPKPDSDPNPRRTFRTARAAQETRGPETDGT